jgi:thiamine-phosphate pyrophosphorylase
VRTCRQNPSSEPFVRTTRQNQLSEPSVRTARQNLPRLYAIVDVDVAVSRGFDARALAAAYVSGGARLLQLRAKSTGPGALVELARAIVADAHQHGALVVINDRPDVARLAGADGVHVGQDDLPPDAVRRVWDAPILGLSTHSREQFAAAMRTTATYIAVGPVFGTATKDTGYTAIGPEFVRWAAAIADRPIVAIGGITLDNAAQVIAAGAASVAVISDLIASGEPAARVRQFVARL